MNMNKKNYKAIIILALKLIEMFREQNNFIIWQINILKIYYKQTEFY